MILIALTSIALLWPTFVWSLFNLDIGSRIGPPNLSCPLCGESYSHLERFSHIC